MRARELWVCMAVIFSLSASGYSQADQTDQKDKRAIAFELAELACPEETIVVAGMGGAKLAIAGAFDKNPKTREYAAVLEKAILEVLEATFRDPETIRKFRDMQAGLFLETYNESELRDMLIFYRTPTGKKVIRTLPEITRKGMERGVAIADSLSNSPKFKERLDAMIERLVAEGKIPKGLL